MHTWVEISRKALRANLAAMRRRVPAEAAVCAVVKADAYGHGALECARVFAGEGVEWFAVTSADEGARLRQAGLTGHILVLAGFDASEAATMIEFRLTPAVWDPVQVAWLAAALPAGIEPFPVHLKLDTGMGRLGAVPEQEASLCSALAREPRLRVEAVFSHLSSAEAGATETSHEQWHRFEQARTRLEAFPSAWHLLNSAGALRFPAWSGAMVRLGLSLYGYSPAEDNAGLTPALSWKTRVVAFKELPTGHGVGYGQRFRTPRRLRVATVAAGYADGYRRAFSPAAWMLAHGRRLPVLGTVSMDLTTVEAEAVPGLCLGDEVALIGMQDGERVTAADLAHAGGTIAYEVLCGISARVTRRYVD